MVVSFFSFITPNFLGKWVNLMFLFSNELKSTNNGLLLILQIYWIEWINTNIPKDGINRNTSVYTTYRQTDEQTDRQKDWQTDKQKDRHACLHAHRNAQPLCCVLREIPDTLGVRSTLHLHWSVSLLTWPLTCIPLWSGDLILHHTHCLVILFVFVSIVWIYFFLAIFLQVHLQAFIPIRNLHIYIYIYARGRRFTEGSLSRILWMVKNCYFAVAKREFLKKSFST